MRNFSVVVLMATSLSACHQSSDLFQKKERSAAPAPGNTPNQAQPPETERPGDTSYIPVAITESFADMRARLVAGKPEAERKQNEMLNARYDMSSRAEANIYMSRGKPVQTGVRVRLRENVTWEQLGQMTPEQIKQQNLFPDGFMPLPHPRHEEGGQVLPQFHIDEIMAAEGRNLLRFDVELDIPDHFLPEFPAPIFLTTRPDLGDVSQGVLITNKNFFEIFDGILTPRQLDGLRLLVTPFAQQQFNVTNDRRTDSPELGISCFDCHANGHTNGATHLDPVTRPQEFRRRLDVPTLRGLNIQRLFGSQRAMKTVEDFTEFEQLGAYFDGDHVTAAKKGFNKLDRALQVAHMAEFQSILDFPPAPKLDINGRLIPAVATSAELRGEELFYGKAECASCHPGPYFTDNSMHDLKAERFFKPQNVNGRLMTSVGPIKTFPLRGIRHSPPYLHDGRLLTLDDTVEFFNLVLELRLTEAEKKDLLAFLYVL
ncbi:cytochrome B6 [Oligoflexus tunisiensis]|uniref:cytochrome B6 n=1 Tax=Oligoflexus tunisiensis TaxID=708132 RepID=UPI000A45928D|nr:cytochrome B6 [Oligoflexus tunisiensis]